MIYKPDICIYHANCDDGFAAAWAVWRKWPDVEFIACQYGNLLPEKDFADCKVLIVDFSFSAALLEELGQRARSVVVLDHHITAEVELARFTKAVDRTYLTIQARINAIIFDSYVVVSFDMERSGARMAWEFCHPEKEVPPLIQAVEDRDLWRFALPETRLVTQYLRSISQDFDEWNAASELYNKDPETFLTIARGIERYYNLRVEEMVEGATVERFADHEGVPVVRVPYAFVSDSCHQLLSKHPDAPFAVAIVEACGGRTCSLRSSDEREDVSKIAKKFGGGGHRNAAGFRLPV
ncbi:DHHA1 domain-containing protein [Pseudovibrio sp. POLY-S9]|uniref:DHHA1 domain-containing protein n=1 Tax=Pseudovibrio sp. POLY-S9 TaxID=1576596 RepID=UPI0007100D32|nr:DHHA1 domain-containing protein [Pseudovibrio sp. POLY-S9]